MWSVLVVLICLLIHGVVFAATHIVDPTQSIQAAVDLAQPGDTIQLRAGTYTCPTTGARECITFTRSGTASQPITLEAYPGEDVLIQGWGYDDSDDGTGNATGPNVKTNQTLILVNADYIHIKDLRLEESSRWGIQLFGKHALVENVDSSRHWEMGFNITGERNVLRYVSSHHNRHQSGFNIARPGSYNLIEWSAFWRNGYHDDDTPVLPYPGDPGDGTRGGGNSDSGKLTKSCESGGVNYCLGNVIRYTVGWKSADGGYDDSTDAALFYNNVMAQGGSSVGVVSLKTMGRTNQRDTQMIGNIVCKDHGRGVELRGDNVRFHNNLMVVNGGNGVYGANSNQLDFINNIAADNSGADFHSSIASSRTYTTNWAKDASASATYSGDPQFRDADYCTMFDGSQVPRGLSIKETVEWVRNAFFTAYTYEAGSSAIDAGTPVSYTDPISGSVQSVPFDGNAPDVGPVEIWRLSGGGTIPPPIPDTVPPAAPTNLRLISRGYSATTVTIVARATWEAPTTDINGDPVEIITGYTLCIANQAIPDDKAGATCQPEPDTSTEIVTCPSGRACFWRVSASNAGGEGPLSAPRVIEVPQDYIISP